MNLTPAGLFLLNACDAAVRPRREIELDIVTRILHKALSEGRSIWVEMSGDSDFQEFSSVDSALAQLLATDEAWLKISLSPVEKRTGCILFVFGDDGVEKRTGCIFFVFGNDGYDCICDHSLSLESWLQPVFEYIDQTWG